MYFMPTSLVSSEKKRMPMRKGREKERKLSFKLRKEQTKENQINDHTKGGVQNGQFVIEIFETKSQSNSYSYIYSIAGLNLLKESK